MAVSTTSEATSWEDREPGFGALHRELRRMVVRSGRRPIITVLTLFLVAGALAGAVALRLSVPRARVVIRVTEPQGEDRGPGTEALRALVEGLALSHARLAQIMEANGLMPPGVDQRTAVNEFRQTLELEVEQNRTISLLPTEDRPRSAYVVISVRTAVPDLSLAIAQMLGTAVVEAVTAQSRQRGEAEIWTHDATIAELRASLGRLRDEATATAQSSDPLSGYKLVLVRRELHRRADRIARLEASRSELLTQLRADDVGLGIETELIEPELEEQPVPREQRLAAAAVGAVALALPAVILLVGAFDPTVFAREDVERIGIPCLGHVAGIRHLIGRSVSAAGGPKAGGVT